MFATPVRVLVVGLTSANTQAMLERWRRSGWGAHTVESLQEAETVLRTIRFKVILAAENLHDGSGYELAPLVARQSGSLFISVALSETCLWLPVIEQGIRELGKRAINPWMLETEVECVLRAFDAESTAGVRDSAARGLSSGPVCDAKGAAIRPGAHLADVNLLNPPVSLSTKTYGHYAGAKQAIPPRRKGTSANGGDHGIETTAERDVDRTSGMHGKRRVE